MCKADHYYATGDPETFQALAGTSELIVNTVSAHLGLDAYLGLLAVDGTLVNVGAPADPLSLNVFSLITGRRTFAGSMIGGIAETQEMLDFCAKHDLGADVEVISADKINEAYQRACSPPTSATGSSSTPAALPEAPSGARVRGTALDAPVRVQSGRAGHSGTVEGPSTRQRVPDPGEGGS